MRNWVIQKETRCLYATCYKNDSGSDIPKETKVGYKLVATEDNDLNYKRVKVKVTGVLEPSSRSIKEKRNFLLVSR